ncbi:hypothetical protein EMPS_06689 [Entomortierella parvispora]|uniref:Uncharacterized protein n=1 Tax=Entomortierella parvispora TaxID=205924 RepID=A0A9P3HCQ1_9FUNG|nr:hypothetical protein EMPS_02079 [Entomortierella parvispora]GJJ74331.1 hypothetical protein EMPS_06689 [Entomortierella parvispora]
MPKPIEFSVTITIPKGDVKIQFFAHVCVCGRDFSRSQTLQDHIEGRKLQKACTLIKPLLIQELSEKNIHVVPKFYSATLLPKPASEPSPTSTLAVSSPPSTSATLGTSEQYRPPTDQESKTQHLVVDLFRKLNEKVDSNTADFSRRLQSLDNMTYQMHERLSGFVSIHEKTERWISSSTSSSLAQHQYNSKMKSDPRGPSPRETSPYHQARSPSRPSVGSSGSSGPPASQILRRARLDQKYYRPTECGLQFGKRNKNN